MHPAPDLSPLARDWFVVPPSAEVPANAALARSLLGTPVVLYRGAGGAVVALEDRCLHRGVALSLGRVRNGEIACPYHGWRYDSGGACVAMPCALPGEPLPKKRVRALAVREHQGS